MKIYQVLSAQENIQSLDDVVFVKEGFSLWAFVFQVFWFLYNKLWLGAGAVLLVSLVLKISEKFMLYGESMNMVLGVLLSAFVGFFAHDIHVATLRAKGYQLVDIVSANNLNDAYVRFLDRQNSESPVQGGKDG